MRKLKIFFMLTVLFSYAEVNSQWVVQHSDSIYSLMDIKFSDESAGFACGYNFNPQKQIYTSVIYKTINGGNNWNIVFADTNLFLQAIVLIDNAVIAGGGRYYVTEPKLLKSTNGGNNWFYISPGNINSAINSFQFFNDKAYVTCVSGIFRSTNSGQDWISSIAGFSQTGSSYFINGNTGWYAYDNYYIFKTTNAGLNWTNTYFIDSLCSAKNIYFINNNTGFAIYDIRHSFNSSFLKTTNSGYNWSIIHTVFPTALRSIEFINEHTGYVCGSRMLKTTNTGEEWQELNIGTNATLTKTTFINSNTGYASGSKIIKTTTGGVIGINPISTQIPSDYSLAQNYPNPFNPTTNIKFAVPKASYVRLAVYDMLGREVEALVNEQLSPGTYEVDWNAAKFSSGIYMYNLTTNDFSMVKKMSLIK